MHFAIRRISLATLLLMLALPACAKSAAQSNAPQGAGEAASQERRETGIDNEPASRPAQKTHANSSRKTTAASTHPKATLVQSASSPRNSSAQLKTGQLTTTKSAHLQTRQTAMHQNLRQDGETTGSSNTDAKSKTSKSSNDIHLKKHNARMF